MKTTAQSITTDTGRNIARPLKVLIPLIQSELQQGDSAGREHYTNAGEMLIEAKESDQVPHGSWSRWLTKNFDLSQRTAQVYMQWARQKRSGAAHLTSLRSMTGHTGRDREKRNSTQQQQFRRVLRDVAADTFVQERQARDDEVELHRELAEELIDLGYRALATKLHPDRGGSKDAMARLNRVRDELKQIAQTRRFL
jgi:hypothetical protein